MKIIFRSPRLIIGACSFSRPRPSHATIDTRLVQRSNACAGEDGLTALPSISRRPGPAYTATKTLQTRTLSLIFLHPSSNHDPSYTGSTPPKSSSFQVQTTIIQQELKQSLVFLATQHSKPLPPSMRGPRARRYR